jgi:hypothetical protein
MKAFFLLFGLCIFVVLGSFSSALYCFQESANVSNQSGRDGVCGLNYSGNFFVNLTYSPNGESFENYAKPIRAVGALEQIKYGANIPSFFLSNFSVPSDCLSYNSSFLNWRYETQYTSYPSSFFSVASERSYCRGADWILVQFSSGQSGFGESNFSINVSSPPYLFVDGNYDSYATHVALDNGSGTFNYFWYSGYPLRNDSALSGNLRRATIYDIGIFWIIPEPSASILPLSAYANSTLGGFCNSSVEGDYNFSYDWKWYVNGILNVSGTSGLSPSGVAVNVANLSNIPKGNNV